MLGLHLSDLRQRPPHEIEAYLHIITLIQREDEARSRKEAADLKAVKR